MILANWYVFYSYGWYVTWTVSISFDKHSVSLWRRDCSNAIIEVISALTHVMIHFLIHQGLKWGNLWSIFHIFAPLKHPFMFLMCIYFMVFDRERLLLGHLLPSLMFIEYWEEFIIFILHADDTQFKLSSYCNFSSKCWIASFISCLSLFWNLNRL